MLFNILKSQVAKFGLTDDLRKKIDVFFLADRLTMDQYKELIQVPDDAEPADNIELVLESNEE